MTHVNRLPAPTKASNRTGRRSLHAPPQSSWRPNIHLISDAVVASYIHDISLRHRNGVDPSEAVCVDPRIAPDPDRAARTA